jgi:hypothetical protein
MRTLATEAEAVMDLLIDRLDDLAYASEPAAPSCRPRLATPLRWAHHRRAVPMPPACRGGVFFAALLPDIRAQSRLPNARAARLGGLAQGKTGFGQCLSLGAGRSAAATGADPTWLDRDEEREAFRAAEAVTPANGHEARPPATPPTLGLPRRHR